MRLPILFLPVLFLGCATGPESTAPLPSDDAINAQIGDESFGRTFGRAPTADDGDELRIATHLGFVEATLRARDVSHLPVARQIARVQMLDRLNAYWRAGLFPRNPEGTARVPRFVEPASADSERRVCAVGAIAEPDLGSAAIDAIAAKYEHDYIASIHDPAFEKWALASGLTLDELAMIQPSYEWMRPPDPESELTEKEIASRFGLQQRRVNYCIYDVLSARQAHPAQVSASFTIGADGVTRDVAVTGTTHPTIRACVENAVRDVRVRKSPEGKRGTHTFTIIGPRKSDGTLETGYLPTLFDRANEGVNRCGQALTIPNQNTLRISVRTEVSPQGLLRVRVVRGEVDETPLPRSMTTCIARAVEAVVGPTFKGDPQEHEHVFFMRLARPLAGF